MKISNYVLISLIAILGFSTISSVRPESLTVMTNLSQQYNAILDTSLDSAVGSMIESDDGTLHLNKDECANAFMRSVYAGFGVIDNPSLCDEIKPYIPILVVADRDGFYVRYYEYQDNSYSIVEKWSIKYPYTYQDSRCVINFRMDEEVQVILNGYNKVYEGDYRTLLNKYRSINTGSGTAGGSEYQKLVDACMHSQTIGTTVDASPLRSEVSFELARQQAITDCIIEKMNYYLNKHNDVARAFGIQYTFRLPDSASSEIARSCSDVMFMGVFQGYPLGIGTGSVYNKFCISGTRVFKGTKFYVRRSTEDGFLYYHTERCSLGENVDSAGEENWKFDSIEEAAAAGAYPCPYCRP